MIRFSMSTWNVASVNPNFPKRAERIAHAIPGDTTILCVQEGGDTKKSSTLRRQLEDKFDQPWNMTKAGTGQVVFTRPTDWLATSHRIVKLGANKAALMVKLEHHTGVPLVVVNPHLSPYSTATRRKLRARQIRLLVADVYAYAGPTPIIMAGDFNDGDKGVHRFLLSHGWTYHAPTDRHKTTVPGKPGVPIDRFYSIGKFTFSKVRIDTSTTKQHSDHYRVGAIVKLNK